MLRRLVRNLLENARRYGGGAPIDVSVGPVPGSEGGALLVVEDRGPGIPEAECELRALLSPHRSAARALRCR
jgi:signal transduction histidine kinase